ERALQVVQLDLACCDNQQGVWSPCVGRGGLDDGFQAADRALEILDGVQAAAAIEAGVVYQGALRVALNELSQTGDRFLVLPGTETLHGLIVGGLLCGVSDLDAG